MAVGGGVAGSRVDVGVSGVRVIVAVLPGGAGVGVTVAGGVIRRSSFCPGWMMEADVSPFHASNSDKVIS